MMVGSSRKRRSAIRATLMVAALARLRCIVCAWSLYQ